MTDSSQIAIQTPKATDFQIESSPYYTSIGNECSIFEAACKNNIPVLLKGPTGCGKTRFVHHMAHHLKRPLITVSCHEDLSASDLVGRFLLKGDDVFWSDGPMTAAVRMGAILYLDEVVEARKDTLVAIHSLTDHRRTLSIDKLATNIHAAPGFMLVISYNPGYQSLLKELKPSTRQRFISLAFDYPDPEKESDIIHKESGLDTERSMLLARLAQKIRHLTDRGLQEGVSTRLLIHAARLINGGVSIHDACQVAFTQSLSDDPVLCRSIGQLVLDFFPKV